MSSKLIFYCDNEREHKYSYEQKAGQTDKPYEAGWFTIEQHTLGCIDCTIKKATSDPNDKAQIHFCSWACLLDGLETLRKNESDSTTTGS